MNHICTCTGASAFSHQNHRHQKGSKTCKNCGCKPSVDGLGAPSGSMLSTVGQELAGIDPHLNWKAYSKGRQRALRRARASFTGGNKKSSTAKSSKESEDLTVIDPKRTEDMPFSESEKLGVSILGRRFSDTLESVPIKKRRFMLVRSPSPPLQSSSHSDDSDQIREGRCASYEEAASNAQHHALDINSGVGEESGQEGFLADEKTNMEDLNEKLCNTADFSGISMLAAAAACDTSIGGGITKAEASVSKEHYSQEEINRCAESEEKEEKIYRKEDLVGKNDIPSEVPNKLVLPCRKSDGTKLDGSCNLDNSTRYMQNVPNQTGRVESSSRDDRLHWDLNTVMDVWESHSDEVMNSEPLAASTICEDGICNEKPGNVELCRNQIVLGDVKSASDLVDSRNLGGVREGNCVSEETEVQKPDGSSDNAAAGHNEGKDSPSLLHGLVQEEHKLEDASVAVADAAEESKPLHNQEKSSFITGVVSSPIGGELVFARNSSLVTATFDNEKADAQHVVVETEVSCSPLVSCDNANLDRIPACEPLAGRDQITEVVYEKNTSAASVADPDDHSAHCCPTDVQIGQTTNSRSPRVEKHASLHADLGNHKIVQCSVASQLAEEASDVMVGGIVCNDMMNAAGLSIESAQMNILDEADCGCLDKFKEGNMSTFQSDSRAFKSKGLSNHGKLSSGSACAGEDEAIDADMKMQDSNCSVPPDEILNNTKPDFPILSDSEVPICSSALMKPVMVDVPPVDGALISHGACKSYVDGYVSSPGQVALEDHFDCDYDSDASHIDTDHPTGMGDDDYQYEDGEFRESVLDSWGEDGSEGEENEHVDYGSDNKETDILVAASDFPASVPLHVDDVEIKNVGPSDANHDHKYGGQVGKESQVAVSKPLVQCSLLTDASDAGSARRKIKDGSKNSEDAKDDSESGAFSDQVIGDRECLNGGDASRESSQLASFGMKLSGWDRLPEGCIGSGGGVMDSVNRNHADASLEASNVGKSFRRVAGSSLRCDLSSRVEMPKASDLTHRKLKPFVRANRSNDRNDLDSRPERGMRSPRSVARDKSSLHMHVRGRHDRWVDSPKHFGPTCHDSRGYYGPATFTNPSPRNVAAAAVAKLESNGFVVTPDGTIVKAGGGGPPGRMSRRSPKASYNCQHRSGPSGGYDPRMVTLGHSETYQVPMPDDNMNTTLPPHHQVSRNEQSFSPHIRPLRQSRTRSPRSRTRSPHMRTSPKVRNDRDMNGAPGLRPRSRSPNFKSEVRIQRLRSPRYRSGMVEHIADYAPSSRNHTSPPHSSRWFDERKDLPEHFKGNEFNRFSRRGSPRRVFSRSHRFDPMDSPGRAKLNEHHPPMHSGNLHEYVGFDRESRHEACIDDRRGYRNRYEMLHSVQQYDNNGNMKRFRFDSEDGFRAHNPRPRSSEFQRRGSPRGFVRGIENQLEDLPLRAKEKVPIRYGRDGKHDAVFKPFGVRDCEDDMTPRRRPS